MIVSFMIFETSLVIVFLVALAAIAAVGFFMWGVKHAVVLAVNSIIGFFLILIGVLVSTLHGIPVSWLVFIFGSMCLMGTLWVWLTLPCLEKLQGTATSSEA